MYKDGDYTVMKYVSMKALELTTSHEPVLRGSIACWRYLADHVYALGMESLYYPEYMAEGFSNN